MPPKGQVESSAEGENYAGLQSNYCIISSKPVLLKLFHLADAQVVYLFFAHPE